MKKFLALLLGVLFLATFTVSAVAANAKEKIDCRELEEYGQKHYYLGDIPEKAPDVEDAKISEGEYAVSYEFKDGADNAFIDSRDPGASIIDNEWARVHISYDEKNLYLAMETKDKNYIKGKDGISYNISFKDRGTGYDAITRMCFDIYQHPEAVEDDISTFNTKCRFLIKNDAGEWDGPPTVEGLEYITDISGRYDESTQIFCVELEIYLPYILEFWENDLPLEDVRMSIMPFVWMYGESANGAGDEIRQGIMWNYLYTSKMTELKEAFLADHSYAPPFVPNIVHFCAEGKTSQSSTTTAEVTTSPVTETATTSATETATDIQTTPEITDGENNGGCASSVASPIVALIGVLSASTAIRKRKRITFN